jgi:DNA polymerase-3 subunit alpha
MSAVAVTDHGRAGGLLKLQKECKKADIKPIYGIELYVAPESRFTKERLENYSKTSYHLTVFAKNKEGLKNIFRLTSRSWQDGLYYGKPRCDIELLKEHSEGLVVLSGCGSGHIAVNILEDKYSQALKHAKVLKEIFKDNFYIEIQNHNLSWQLGLNNCLELVSEEINIPLVITQDAHYQNKEDHVLHNHVCKITSGDLIFDSNQNWFKSRGEMEEMFDPKYYPALDITNEIASKCNVEWDHSRTIWPVYKISTNKSAEGELKSLAQAGLCKRFPNNITKEYQNRLDYELEVIKEMGFSNYFLIVQDFANWCEQNNFTPSPGRGSSSASLVCYSLRITHVDPIKYKLPFSRFLNKSRVSLPDIDYDADRNRRNELLKYIMSKYGSDKVAQIGTYAEFKPRGSLRAFARVLGYSPSVQDYLASLIPGDIAGKTQKFNEILEKSKDLLNTKYPEVVDLARKSEGLKMQMGIHAAGVVISDDPVNEIIPLFAGRNGETASQFDMKDIEDIGLVKFDFLGLKTLSIISDTRNFIKETTGKEINLLSLEDGDPKTYKLFHNGDLDGIFQFETSAGFKELCMQVKPNKIEDLSACTAIYRPGPLSSGVAETYIKRRQGEKYKLDIPELEEILKDTYGLIVFQEQISRICIAVAGYSDTEADNMRRIVGKKIPEKMKAEKEKFISGCIKNGTDKSLANKLFEEIEGFAAYGFCLGHACAYSFLSYWTGWLKAHYPVEFYTAILNNCENQDDIIKYIYAIRTKEIPLVPPDVNRSYSKFTIDNGTIVFGLSGIKGLGEKACSSLVEKRPSEGFTSLADLVINKIPKNNIEALAECGALEGISSLGRHQIVENIEELIAIQKRKLKWEEGIKKREVRNKEIKEAVERGDKPPRRLPKMKEENKPVDLVLPEPEEMSRKERLRLERKTLGFYLTGHPLDDYSKVLSNYKYQIKDLQAGEVKDKEKIHLPIIVSSLKTKCSKKKQNYATLLVEDQTGKLDATIFPKTWEKVKEKAKEDRIFIADARVGLIQQDDSPPIVKLIINNLINPSFVKKELSPIKVHLSDCIVEFIPSETTSESQWVQANKYKEIIETNSKSLLN